jgi:hypothetical protein
MSHPDFNICKLVNFSKSERVKDGESERVKDRESERVKRYKRHKKDGKIKDVETVMKG